jgi:hypothetical protein
MHFALDSFKRYWRITLMIDDYDFGRIVINGKPYTNDVRIIEGKTMPNWWRKEGHMLLLQDIKDLLEKNPKTIIVGKGYSSQMDVDSAVTRYCKENNIELIELPTEKAVKKYNELEGPGVIGLFHLTC